MLEIRGISGLFVALTMVGCAARPTTLPILTHDEARATIHEVLARSPCNGCGQGAAAEITIRPGAAVFVQRRDGHPERRVRMPFDHPIREDVCAFGACTVFAPAYYEGFPGRRAWRLELENTAETPRFLAAFNTLVVAHQRAIAEDTAFGNRAAAWRALKDKPPLSPEGNRHRIVAESAFREKDAAAALEHYAAAVAADPLWPAGNFNLALICGELGEYDCAVRYMKRYLLLAPDARDAKAAGEKLIVWEEKARRG